MSDESDLEIPELPALARASTPQKSIEELQRKEIEALRLQVLERASENSILTARMRDVDEVFSRRLSEQVVALSASREAQASEIESTKRDLATLERKYAFLERENKTLAVKNQTSSSLGTRHSSLGDGFMVKRRRPDFDAVQEPGYQQFRHCLAECKLASGKSALQELGTDSIAAILAIEAPDTAANYLLGCLARFDILLLPACLRLLSSIIEFTDTSQLNLASLNSAITSQLKGLQAFPDLEEAGDVHLDRSACYALTTTLYALDLLIYCSKPPPYTLIEQLLRNPNPILGLRGLMLLQLAAPIEATEKNIMADITCASFSPSIHLLFGGLWDEMPLDATNIPEYSQTLLHLQWPKRQIKIVCNEMARKLRQEFDFQIVRAISLKQTIEPKLWYKVVTILLNTEDNDSKLAKTCVRYIWKQSPMPNDFESKVYTTLLVTKLSRVASLTTDPDTSYWCQEILRQIISPQEDEMLRGMMNY